MRCSGCSRVLIETLWNVKLDISMVVYPSFLVLIETLWNVKQIILRNGGSAPCINRNIVECKVYNDENGSTFTAVLIETLWNVKTPISNGSNGSMLY